MIIKCLSRKSGTGQLLRYLFKNEEKLSADGFKQTVIKHNLRSRTVKNWTKEFEKNEALRLHKRKDAVAVHHSVISFSANDKERISEKMLRDVAGQFIALRGKDSLHLIVAHYNTQSIHLHCVTSGTKYITGKGNRLSKTELLQLKNSLQAFQERKYPQLTRSLPQHGKSAIRSNEKPIADRRTSKKNLLMQSLESAYSKAKSKDAFLNDLKAKGYEPYYRGPQQYLAGVKDETGLKFRLERLGYDTDKLAKLDMRLEQENALSEIRDIRERQGGEREQAKEPDSSYREIDEDMQDQDILDRDHEESEKEVSEFDDRDDREP